MIHPEFAIAGSFEHLKLGAKPPKHDARTLQLASYLDETIVLPEIPAKEDWTLGVRTWPMFGNDRLGDCTCAAAGHMIQAWSHAAGHPKTPADASVIAMYRSTGDGTDDGRYELDVLNYWRHHGLGRDRITAYVAVNARNVEHVKAAIFLFGGVYTGIALPKTAQHQQVWDVVGDLTGDSKPGSWGGHAVPYHAYRQEGEQAVFTCVTWGGKLDLTEAFHLSYTDE